jgi:hypothetical protein
METKYAVNLGKEMFEMFKPKSGIAPIGGTYGKFEVVEKTDGLSFYGFRFSRKKDAVNFAIWSSAWASAYKKDGTVLMAQLLC